MDQKPRKLRRLLIGMVVGMVLGIVGANMLGDDPRRTLKRLIAGTSGAVEKTSAVEKVVDAQEGDDRLQVRSLGVLRRKPAPEAEILPDRQMGKEPSFLEDISDPPSVCR